MDDIVKLEAEYCPPLDPALFSAIASDHDLSTSSGLQEARSILDQLKESANAEEAAGFDPSGSGGYEAGDRSKDAISAGAHSTPETVNSQSRETDLTSVSNGLSSLDLTDSNHSQDGDNAFDLECLDEETKVSLLQDVFGDRVSNYSIRHTLRTNGCKWNGAMEVLLNHVYFDEAHDSEEGSKVSAKGIDGFSEDQIYRRNKHKKKKNRKYREIDHFHRERLSSPTSDGASTLVQNKWQAASSDVEFIASRMKLNKDSVRSTYNEHGASIPQTIAALLKWRLRDTDSDNANDSDVATLAQELGQDFPTITLGYRVALIRATQPSTVAAHELAKALVARSSRNQGGIPEVIPHYTRPSSLELDETRPLQVSSGTQHPGTSQASTLAKADSYAAARAQAFAQASAAHRKAKSDRHMGGAATYYSQLGREYSSLSLSAAASAADALAATQCTAGQLDLHGIDVLNGVRIAQEKIETWWNGLGESRSNGRLGAAERSAGYRIIVGLGRHSEGGKGKLGPAVMNMLKAGGWRYENAGAVIIVNGRPSSRH